MSSHHRRPLARVTRARLAGLTVVTVLAVSAALAAGAAPARAQQDEAERLIRGGIELRRQGQNLQALEYFQRSYRIFPTGRAAAQLGFVEQSVGLSLEAEKHVAAALADESDVWVRRNKTAILTALSEIRAGLGRVIIETTPAGATVSINGVQVPNATEAQGVYVKPGANLIEASAGGFARGSATATVLAGTTERVTLRLDATSRSDRAVPVPASASGSAPEVRPDPGAPTPVPPWAGSPPPEGALSGQPGSGRRAGGLALVSGGSVAVIGGIVSMLIASSKVAGIEEDAGAERPYNEANGNYGTYKLLSRVLFAGGGGALLTGGWLLWSGNGAARATLAATLRAGDDLGLNLHGSF